MHYSSHGCFYLTHSVQFFFTFVVLLFTLWVRSQLYSACFTRRRMFNNNSVTGVASVEVCALSSATLLCCSFVCSFTSQSSIAYMCE